MSWWDLIRSFVRVTNNSWFFNLRIKICPFSSKDFSTTRYPLILLPLQDRVGKQQKKLLLTSSFGNGIFSTDIFNSNFELHTSNSEPVCELNFVSLWFNRFFLFQFGAQILLNDVIPSGEGEGIMNFLRVTKGNFNFPSHGFAGVVKNKFQPREAEPRVVGILFLYYVHCIIESENLVYGTTNRNFLIIWRNLQIPKKVGSSRSTGCSNSICAKVNTY